MIIVSLTSKLASDLLAIAEAMTTAPSSITKLIYQTATSTSAIPCQSSATVFQDRIGLAKLCAVQICTRGYISPISPKEALKRTLHSKFKLTTVL